MKKEFVLKLVAIFLALITPYILVLIHGPLGALSQYWDTPYRPLFIISNAVTSYFLFHFKHWRGASAFLLLLTAFSHGDYPILHNILAMLFFICSGYALRVTKKYLFYFWWFVIGSMFALYNLLLGEIIAVTCLCAYHFHILLFTHRKIKK